MRLLSRSFAASVSLATVFVLTGCGGSDSPPPDPGPAPAAGNRAPVAVLAAAATLPAGQALAVDASASTDADGDALTYSWDFGDGGKGGGTTLAHVYATAGVRTLTLTVSDGHGGVASATQVITVSAGPAAGPAVTVTGFVGDAAGALSGVTAQLVGGTATGTTDAAGKVTLQLPTGVALVVRLSKAGHADQTVPIRIPLGAPDAMFKAGMLLREATQDFDPVAGATIVGKDGASVTFAAGSLVDAAGSAAAGTAQIAMTPVDIRGAGVALFPGAFAGVSTAGAAKPIASHGTVEFAIAQGGQKLQLAPGRSATVELPIYATLHLDGSSVATGQSIPLWSLDESSGLWVQEGSGTVVASATSPSGLAMRATVGHFSWWNVDTFITPPEPYDPKPRCYRNAGPEFPPIPQACTIGPLLPGEYEVFSAAAATRRRALADTDAFKRTPAYGIRADIPAEGGVTLPLPANLDYVLYACADGGLYCGHTAVNGGPGVIDVPTILLNPVTAATDCSVPTALALPVSQDFAVTDVAAASCFTVAANAGDVLALGTTPNNGSQLKGSFQLFDPSGASLGSASFGPTTSAQTLRRLAPATGSYKVKVTPGAGSPAGGFHLSLTASTATILAVPTPVAALPLTSDIDVRFDIAAGQVLALSVRAHDIYASMTSLVDGTTRSLPASAFDDAYGAFTFRSATAAQGGFHVERGQLTGNSMPQAFVTVKPVIPLAVGDTVTGSIAKGNEVTSYVFDGNAGDIAFATAVSDATGSGEGAPIMRMFDTETVDFNVAQYNVSQPWRAGPYTLPATGSYRVDAYGNSFVSAPNYQLRVVKVAPPTAVVPTGAVTTVNGSIDAVGDQRYYSLALNQGDVFRVSVASPGALGILVDVLLPDAVKPFYLRPLFERLFTADADNSAVNTHDAYSLMLRAPQTGTYTIHAMANSSRLVNALGSYAVTLQTPVATALAPSALDAGTLAAPFGVKRYSVTIATAGAYRFCFRSPAWVQGELRAADGSSLVQTTNRSSSNFADPEFVQTLAAGTYTWDVFARQSAAASFDAIYRPAADAHTPCQ